jgi:hypothetical protein
VLGGATHRNRELRFGTRRRGCPVHRDVTAPAPFRQYASAVANALDLGSNTFDDKYPGAADVAPALNGFTRGVKSGAFETRSLFVVVTEIGYSTL